MAANVILSFLRLNTWPAGLRFHVLWNGSVASNGDGVPPEDPGASVDTDNPLTPQPIAVWPAGKAGHGAEPYGQHPYGHPGNAAPGFGFGQGEYGQGEYGYYNDVLEWCTSEVLPTLRDGTYKFAVRFEDQHGTVQTDALEEVVVAVAGTPRPPTDFSFVGWDEGDGELDLAWAHSPDLE